MRAKKLFATILSLAMCSGSATAASAASECTTSSASNYLQSPVGDTALPASTAVSADNTASVITIKLGDINSDGLIDAADASSVLAAYARQSIGKASGFTPMQAVASDVNQDSVTDAVDASVILSYYAYVSTLTSSPLSIDSFIKKRAESATVTTTAAAATTAAATTTATTTTTAAKTTASATSSVSTAAVTSAAATAPATTAAKTTASSTAAAAATVKTTSTTSAVSTTSSSSTTAAASTTTAATTADPNKVSEIKLSKTEINLNIGDGDISIVTMLPATADKREKWTTSDPKIATVNFEGWIIAQSEGVCTVTVQSVSNPEIKAEIKVTVTDPKKATEIKLSKSEITLNAGESDIAAAWLFPTTADKSQKWTSSDNSIAQVDDTGRITGISEGICTVTVQSVSNPDVKADITVTVIDLTRVREIKLSKNEMTITAGTDDMAVVTMSPENSKNKGAVWISSDESIATVSENGSIKGIAPGYCTVTVISISNPDVKAEIKVTVTDPKQPTGIKLSKYEMDVYIGKMDVSIVSTLPETADDINEIWTSSDVGIAYVDKWGNVTGISAGTCTVTVTNADDPNIKAEVKVTVHDLPVITTTTAAATTTTTSAATTTAAATTTTAATAPAVTVTTHIIQSLNGATYVDGILIVNKSYGLSSDFTSNGLNANAAEHFQALCNDAAELGLNIVCSSGYRSYEYQKQLYDGYAAADGILIADTYSARPGHSEHQTGLAIDVNSINDDFIGTPECEWIAQNAHRYGFIIRYPKGKEAYTGFRYEPWHIRYLGEEEATKVYESGLSLEEYLGIDSYYR